MKIWELKAYLADESFIMDKLGHDDKLRLLNERMKLGIDKTSREVWTSVNQSLVPDELCEMIFADSKKTFYLDPAGNLHGTPIKSYHTDLTSLIILSALEAYRKFGGSALVEVLDYGSYPTKSR